MEDNYKISEVDGYEAQNESIPAAEEPSRYLFGFVAGIAAGIVVGLLVGGLCCLLESIYFIIVVIATALIAFVVKAVSRRSGLASGLISAVSGAVAVVVFTFLMEMQGYMWEDGSAISDSMVLWMLVAAAFCGYFGFKGDSND